MAMSTITVGGVHPRLKILGDTQQFLYDNKPLASFGVINSFIPTNLITSQFNFEMTNYLYSGFRWNHNTTNTDTYGTLALQSFTNAQSTGTDIIKFNSTGVNILAPLNLNSAPGTSGQVLTSQGAGNTPIWTTKSSGTVTSITAGAGLSGGIITGSGTLDITNTTVTPGVYRGLVTINSRGQITDANNISGVLGATHIISNTVTPTVISTANTFPKVLGTSHNSTLNGFTEPDNNKLQYVALDPITAMVSVDLSAVPTLSSTLAIQVYKNGSPIPGVNRNYQVTASKPVSLIVHVPVPFITNDYIEVYITSDNVDNVTVSDMNIVITI